MSLCTFQRYLYSTTKIKLIKMAASRGEEKWIGGWEEWSETNWGEKKKNMKENKKGALTRLIIVHYELKGMTNSSLSTWVDPKYY